jgi:hypothetical protein
MLFHEQPTEPWNEFDFLLVEALQILEDETCSECGNPIWVCRNEDASSIGFKVKTSTCFAKAELDRWQEREEKNKGKRKRHGQSQYVVAYSYDDSPMPSRKSFYMGLANKDKIE